MSLIQFIVCMMILSGFSIIRYSLRMMKEDYDDEIEIAFYLEVGLFIGYLTLLLINCFCKWF